MYNVTLPVMADLDPKTPPQQFHTLHETPAVAKRTHDADYRHGSLGQGRIAVLEELCSVQEVTIEWFLSNLIPERFRGEKMGPSVLTDVTGSLSKSEMTGGCWSAFPIEPSKSQLPETTAFAPFKSVVDAISAAVSRLKPTSTYQSTPERAPLSVRSNATRPDGAFVLTQSTTQTLSEWWNIVCALEFKKTDGEEDRNDVSLLIRALQKNKC